MPTLAEQPLREFTRSLTGRQAADHIDAHQRDIVDALSRLGGTTDPITVDQAREVLRIAWDTYAPMGRPHPSDELEDGIVRAIAVTSMTLIALGLGLLERIELGLQQTTPANVESRGALVPVVSDADPDVAAMRGLGQVMVMRRATGPTVGHAVRSIAFPEAWEITPDATHLYRKVVWECGRSEIVKVEEIRQNIPDLARTETMWNFQWVRDDSAPVSCRQCLRTLRRLGLSPTPEPRADQNAASDAG